MAKLAYAQDLGSCAPGVQVRPLSSAPCRNGLCSVPIFLCRKISHTRRRSSSFAKRHARLACSLVNALTTAHSRYHLFASTRLRREYLNGSVLPKRAHRGVLSDCQKSRQGKTLSAFLLYITVEICQYLISPPLIVSPGAISVFTPFIRA